MISRAALVPLVTGLQAVCILVLSSCASSNPNQPRPEPPPPAVLNKVEPRVVLPRTLLLLEGQNFSQFSSHTLLVEGVVGGRQISVQLPLTFITVQRTELQMDEKQFEAIGEGLFTGSLQVISKNEFGQTAGPQAPLSLEFKRHLPPTLSAVGGGLVHLNSKVQLDGDGFLIGKEGETQAELKGCFLKSNDVGPCSANGTQVAIKLPVTPETETERTRGAFEFSPEIAGPRPGSFVGTISLINVHQDGKQLRSSQRNASFQLEKTKLFKFDEESVSLGQYLDIRGAGFVGGTKGSTVISFAGSFTSQAGPSKGTPVPAAFDLVGSYKDGGWIQYVLEDKLGIGSSINLRTQFGSFYGNWTPTVYWNKESVEGDSIMTTLKLAPVKQVVWVRFSKGWQDALRTFGLLAADEKIRARIFEVMKRDYRGINVEFRETEPQDFKLYVKLDISGKDPNGLGLLGYDNTPGKDVNNMRLYDWLGGVNALTQQDGYPGYGGVFVESLLGFSEHPPKGVYKSPLHTPLFDQVFDPFRPDTGYELESGELLAAPPLGSTAGCPAGDRVMQAACAIRILGNIIGSTAAHEMGHSLGLADPYGSPDQFHNPGDLPNRLMESGRDRPFDERAEINGQGPAVFCQEEYEYMKKILALEQPADPPVQRPSCY